MSGRSNDSSHVDWDMLTELWNAEVDVEQDRLLKLKEEKKKTTKSSSNSSSSTSSSSTSTRSPALSSSDPLASKIRYYRKTATLLERFSLAIEKRAAIRNHRTTFGSGVDTLNEQLRAGAGLAQTGPRSSEPQPAVPNAVAAGAIHMAPVLPDAVRLQATSQINGVLVQQQFLAIPTGVASAAAAADSSSTSSHEPKKQKQLGPFSYVGQQVPQSQSDDTYAEDRSKYLQQEFGSKRRPKCCRKCGHFLSVGPYGVETYHGKKGGGGVVTCKVTSDLYVTQPNRISGWCSCESCSRFATPELRAYLFPQGARIRKPQKRKASSSVGGNCGEDVIGDDGEPAAAAAAEEEAAAQTATSAPVAATSLVTPVSILGGWSSMLFGSSGGK